MVQVGCISPVQRDGRLRHSSFDVDVSELDWLEILYIPAANDREIILPCKLSVFGVGYIEFKTGKSPKFWRESSTDTSNPEWGSYYADRVTLGPQEVERVFQNYIDEGLVPPKFMITSRNGYSSERNARVIIVGTIGFQKFKLHTDNRYLVGITEEILENFEETIAIARDIELRKSRE